MHLVTEYYLPESVKSAFDNEVSGYPQRLNRAVHKRSENEVRKAIDEWNAAIKKFRDNGTISRLLDGRHDIEPKLVERIMSQAYSRTVSPRLELLHKYEAGTDNVYGELLPKFISKILKSDLRVNSEQVLVDLGSGVGNVVLQAALEVGCESWGCEMMNDYCDVAELQQAEFNARCRLWGLSLGAVHLERGDFLTNAAIVKALRRADVVLVNNQVFTPQLNDSLTHLFLDLKEGCKIVSLKSFVPAGHKITARNRNAPCNILRVEKREYFSGCVSWTSAGGEYYISTKDTGRINAFASRS
jgi:H3 lysine-79-specific histone-lysine N-methyltransferase